LPFGNDLSPNILSLLANRRRMLRRRSGCRSTSVKRPGHRDQDDALPPALDLLSSSPHALPHRLLHTAAC